MVRLIETDCTVTYEGRGSTFRDRGVRLLVIKDDKSFLVHKSTGVKPQNYMTNTISIEEDVDSDGHREIIVKSKTEEILVTMYEVMFDISLPSMPIDKSKTVALGTEAQFQAWMTEPSRWTSIYGEDRLFVSREVDSGNGSMDLFGVKRDGSQVVVIELKRHSRKNDVFQVERYREALREQASTEEGFLAFKSMLIDKAVSNGMGGEVIEALEKISPKSLENPDCWLVGSDMREDVDEFAGQHDIKAIAVGGGWIDQAVPDDLARKASTLSNGNSDVRAVDERDEMEFGGGSRSKAKVEKDQKERKTEGTGRSRSGKAKQTRSNRHGAGLFDF